ncbi:MAG: hypothetical protein ABI748_13285 [Dokdonella sp.]
MLEGSKIAVHLRWRPMQPADVSECVDIVAADPVMGPRYGADVNELGNTWRHLLGSAATTTAVFEQPQQKRKKLVAFGISVFVSDEFVHQIKTPPLRWCGPELAKRVTGPDSPILSDTQVRDANSGEGLNALVWESFATPEIGRRPEVYHALLGAFIEAHRGFFLKELITLQSGSADRLQFTVDSGGLYWNPVRQLYATAPPGPAERLVAQPYIVGVTRELAFVRPGSWLSTLFDYRPPGLGLSRGEQQLLLTALASSGGTDRDVADELRLSVPTVKKMWGSAYRRVNACDPELIPDSGQAESGAHDRGREKKRSLLAYVRDHPEELRVYSPKLLTRSLHRVARE